MRAVLKPMLLVAAIFSAAWLAADRYSEQKARALSRCVRACKHHTPRETPESCQAFCACAASPYGFTDIGYVEYTNHYKDRNSSGDLCVEVANSADPRLEK